MDPQETVLQGEVVILRPWRVEDAAWYVTVRDEEIYRSTTERRDLSVAETEVAIRALVEHGRHVDFILIDAQTRARAGNIALSLDADNQGEVSYWLAPAGRGRGLATEAVNLLCAWAWRTLPLTRITLKTHPDNIRSQRVAARAGFRRLATSPQTDPDAAQDDYWFVLDRP